MQLGTVLPLSNSLTAPLASFGSSFVYTVHLQSLAAQNACAHLLGLSIMTGITFMLRAGFTAVIELVPTCRASQQQF
jgi:hypothetical protein